MLEFMGAGSPWQESTTALGPISAFTAVVSALIAWRSCSAARKSARIAEQQGQLTYMNMVTDWQPPVSFAIESVLYRWATNRDVWFDVGRSTDPGIGPDHEVLWAEAIDRELHAEIVISGCLTNCTSEQMLLTLRNTNRTSVRYPTRNEGVFLIGGKDVLQAVLAPKETIRFKWVDRRSFEEWRQLYVATERRNLFGDTSLKPPRLSMRRRLRALLAGPRSPFGDAEWAWGQELISQFGFEIVADSRMAERVSTVWSATLARAAITPSGRDEQSSELYWKLAGKPTEAIDDDVVIYRCRYDATLAQVTPPTWRHVPGRL